MAGIYIYGMEMPKDGAIEIQIFAEGKAIKSGYTVSIDGKDYYAPTLGETPAVQALPVPDHGDLIDRDELEPDDGWSDRCDGFTTFSKLAINCAPVIIPANKVKGGTT